MRDDTNQAPHRMPHQPPSPMPASLHEKLRRGEIGGQALGLIQLVAAQQAGAGAERTGGGELSRGRLAELN